MEPFPHGLWVAAQFLGDLPGAPAVPAAGDQLGVPDPIGGGVSTVHQLTYLALFERIEGRARSKMLGRRTPPFLPAPARFGPALRNDALGPRAWPPQPQKPRKAGIAGYSRTTATATKNPALRHIAN